MKSSSDSHRGHDASLPKNVAHRSRNQLGDQQPHSSQYQNQEIITLSEIITAAIIGALIPILIFFAINFFMMRSWFRYRTHETLLLYQQLTKDASLHKT